MIVSRDGQIHIEIAGPVAEDGKDKFFYADSLIFKQDNQEIKIFHTTDFDYTKNETSISDTFSILGDTELTYVLHSDDASWLPKGAVDYELHLYLPGDTINNSVYSVTGSIEVI